MITASNAIGEKESQGQGSDQGDLFAFLNGRPCVRCGAPFDAPTRRGKGRPRLFCSDTCSRSQCAAQKAEWARLRNRSEIA